VPGGAAGCFAPFGQIMTLEYSDPAYGAVNLLAVDAHALQHPEDHGAKNNPFHLVRLCWLLEHGGDPRLGQGPRHGFLIKIGWRLKSLLLGLRPSVRLRGRNVPSAQADGQPKALEARFQPLGNTVFMRKPWGPRWLQVQFDGNPEIPVLEPPAVRGKVTVVDVYGAASAAEHAERVHRGAKSVWEAWSAHHKWTRRWTSERGGRDRADVTGGD
jgi:hypothetical protein